jgi:hypothetical protein
MQVYKELLSTNVPFRGDILILCSVNMHKAIKERGTKPVRPEETSAAVSVVTITPNPFAATTNAKVKFTLQQATKS